MDLYFLLRPRDLFHPTPIDLKEFKPMSAASHLAAPRPASLDPSPRDPRRTQIHFVLHVPADAPMVDLAAAITAMAESIDGYWEYRAGRPGEPGAFHILPNPQEDRS